jgi:hypothetical protein
VQPIDFTLPPSTLRCDYPVQSECQALSSSCWQKSYFKERERERERERWVLCAIRAAVNVQTDVSVYMRPYRVLPLWESSSP